MRLRRCITVLLVVMALVAVGCGDDDDGEADGTAAPTAGESNQADDVRTDIGVDDSEIRVAVLNDFSGPIASIGTPAAVGSEVFFDQLNADGGVCGRDVTVVRQDTKYDPQQAVQGYRAISDDVAFITQLLGTTTVFALANDVERDGIGTLAGTLTAAVIPLPNIYVYQTPFPLEAINGVSWAAENHAGADGSLQLGVIYQGDAYGEEGLNAVRFAAEQLGNIEIVAEASYATTDEDYTAQVTAMENAGAEVVWLHATPRQTGGVLGVAAQRGYQPLFMGNSATYASALAGPLGDLLGNYRVVTSVANWGEDNPEVQRLMDAVAEHAPDQQADNWLVTGWVSGKITAAILEEACEQGDLTRAGIAAAAEGITVELDGIGPTVTLSNTEVPAREARINEIDVASTFPRAVTDFVASEPARAWSLEQTQSS